MTQQHLKPYRLEAMFETEAITGQDVAGVIKRVVYYGAQSCVSTGGPKEGVVEITANFVRRPLGPELLADLQSILGQGLVLAFCEASDDSETLFVYIRDGV